MKEKIKELRVSIDGLAQLTKELKPIYIAGNRKESEGSKHIEKYCTRNSKEINKAYDSLILAKAWLGKILQELGESTPYANDGSRKEIKDIEPTADTHRGIKHLEEKGNWNTDYNHIEKVDWLREEIKNILDKYLGTKDSFTSVGLVQNNINNLSWKEVAKHLSEARFWLGFELGRVRDNDNPS